MLAATKTELFYDQNIYKEQLDDGDLSSIANELVCGSDIECMFSVNFNCVFLM